MIWLHKQLIGKNGSSYLMMVWNKSDEIRFV